MTGNDVRLLCVALTVVLGLATQRLDVAVVFLAGGLMFANFIATIVKPRNKTTTSPPQHNKLQPDKQPQVQHNAQPATQQSVAGFRLADIHPDKRQHMIIAAKPGDGKTTTANTLLVEDCARNDVQVIVCNPHFTYYHPEDQRIDLRMLRDRFDVVFGYAEIAATLKSLYATVQKRMEAYREGGELGHTIVVYIDEWPAIASDEQHGKTCCTYLSKLIREARKVRIWIVLCSQDALVETLQLSGGLRASFHTCLVGNVDATTWRSLTGGLPQVVVKKGTWVATGNVNGIAIVLPPDDKMVAAIAQQTHKRYTSPVAPADKSLSEVGTIGTWLLETPRPSNREVARRLYKLRGGTNTEYDGTGDLYYETVDLIQDAESVTVI